MHPSFHLEPYRTLLCPIIDAVCMLHLARLSFCFPILSNTPFPLHIADKERRCSTSIISNALPEETYASLFSVLFPLTSQYGSLEGWTHKYTIIQPPHLLVLVFYSTLLRLPVKEWISTLGSVLV